MKQLLPSLSVVLFAVALVGCDGAGNRYDRAGVLSVPFTFDVNGAVKNGNVLSEQIDFPEITQRVVDLGAVMVYFEEQDTWTALPYTYGVESATEPLVDYTVTLGYAFDTHLVEVFYETSADPDVLSLPGSVRMKAVIFDAIPTGKNAPDLRDYQAVKRYYGLDD
ncbi:MAG TPA: hypothetical protein VFG50_12300 [Rhodothermales bacterium]|nr:hypothetical protein [Rhodothermales bacterium]